MKHVYTSSTWTFRGYTNEKLGFKAACPVLTDDTHIQPWEGQLTQNITRPLIQPWYKWSSAVPRQYFRWNAYLNCYTKKIHLILWSAIQFKDWCLVFSQQGTRRAKHTNKKGPIGIGKVLIFEKKVSQHVQKKGEKKYTTACLIGGK